ncbi:MULTISPECIES: hypothetical protein [Bacillaceae]|uniref:Uncharacterized protein n=2 Tax=Bacillaceae TaxID=186817 RepID=A0ABD4A3K9_9BACI|nr:MULTISPECIES: hypothetical protein [Bacillaceae]KIO58364.1 hypothetical protein B4064_3775 [Caldibacillus thermoamylovorans]KIO63187.1 hypothetical protein B4166_3081 [Caldibacillus thermoamylovorans]KIO71615.1 hypothetical protein B4167_3564 [Caldibacillus thermoamylovorans]MED4853473.1 hypothetical protein [Caldifermentibacillus hisashii]
METGLLIALGTTNCPGVFFLSNTLVTVYNSSEFVSIVRIRGF